MSTGRDILTLTLYVREWQTMSGDRRLSSNVTARNSNSRFRINSTIIRKEKSNPRYIH